MFTWNFMPFNHVWPWTTPSTFSTLGQCLQCKCWPTIRFAMINSSSSTLSTYSTSISCQPIKKLCSRQQQVIRLSIVIIWIFVFCGTRGMFFSRCQLHFPWSINIVCASCWTTFQECFTLHPYADINHYKKG